MQNKQRDVLPRLTMVLVLTFTVLLAEIVGAHLSGSLSLLADAGHMAVDSVGLVAAMIGVALARHPRTDQYTWGWARIEVISAAFQAGMLLIVCGSVAVEAAQRLSHRQALDPQLMLIFAGVGLTANIISMLMLLSHRSHNLNLRAAFLEVTIDALGSVAVLVGAVFIWLFQFHWADVIASLVIVAMMAPRAVSLLRNSLRILLEATPNELDLDVVRAHLLQEDHVLDVHDLHVSTIATGTIALSAHVTVTEECFHSGHSLDILHKLQECLAQHFPVSIDHSTIQLDSPGHRDHERLKHPTTPAHPGHHH